jgi:hypothetical protein
MQVIKLPENACENTPGNEPPRMFFYCGYKKLMLLRKNTEA